MCGNDPSGTFCGNVFESFRPKPPQEPSQTMRDGMSSREGDEHPGCHHGKAMNIGTLQRREPSTVNTMACTHLHSSPAGAAGDRNTHRMASQGVTLHAWRRVASHDIAWHRTTSHGVA